MGTAGDILFVVAAGIALVSAVTTVTVRTPLRAAVALLVHIISLAGLYLTLNAHLLAALQLIVYAGAVVVLFIFVIMLLGPSATTPAGDLRGLLVRTSSAALMGLVTVGLAFTMIDVAAPYVKIPPCPPGAGAECGQFGGVKGLGMVIYTETLVPFELVGVLLLVAIVGAMMVARGRSPDEVEEARKHRRAREQDEAAKRADEKRLAAEVSAHGGH
jgi:NADH-quinone oxidoreductase subunit J